MKIAPRLPFAFVAGMVSATGFAPLDLWPLTIAAFAVLLAMVIDAARLRGALALGWWFGFGHFVIGLNWIATAFTYQAAMPAWLGWIAVALLSLYLAVFPAVATGLAWRWGRADPVRFALIFAAAWILSEWLRASLFTGFAWNPLGVVALPIGGTARIATLVGTFGLSGLVALAAGGLLMLVRGRRLAGAVALLVAPAAAALLVQLPARTTQPAAAQAGALMRIVQPNIGQDKKWQAGFEGANYRRLFALSGAPAGEPRLLLWPEAAVPDYLEEEPRVRRRLAGLLGPRDVLLTGGVALEFGGNGRVIAARNSLFAMNAASRLLWRYDKAHLVPYGEYLPMRPILSAIGLSRLAPGDLDFWPGPGAQSFVLPGFGVIGVQICYEIIFPGHVVDAAHRPTLLFNPSNDAWFGAWGPPQHLAQARLRAIEEGITVVRSTPTGISAVIGADGRLLASLPWRTAGAIDWRIPRPTAPPLFARFGNMLSLLLGFALVGVAIALRKPSR
ncbi:MAG: apolipoprotein N-acyltransferase [Sphingomonas bacterium]|nr:apolipoprotein N-acyltransferase [Sphingomonas bacterium]MDB5689193.1 apolipoprotein N-acyltransferase [Sphingomonas bacterium]